MSSFSFPRNGPLAAGRPLKSILKKRSPLRLNSLKKRVLLDEVAYDAVTRELVTLKPEYASRRQSLDREQRIAEGLALRRARRYERLVANTPDFRKV